MLAHVKTSTLAQGWVSKVERIVHRGFLPLLMASYLLAAWIPCLGYRLRGPLWFADDDLQAPVSPSRLLLAVLLFLTGLSIDLGSLWNAVRRPIPIIGSLFAKLFVPTLFVLLLTVLGTSFAAASIRPELLLGLALVAAMPAASSSPAWTQKSGGDVTLSLGIVVGSTLLCPWFGGLWWRGFGELLSSFDAHQAAQLDQLAISVFGTFFLSWLLVPSLLGMGVRYALGARRRAALQPHVRLLGNVILLLLIYAFTSTSLSKVVSGNQFLQMTSAFGLAILFCAANFLAGWCFGKLSRCDRCTRLSMLYGIGMHNNGIALLVADHVLAADSIVFLPIIASAMCQHVAAGVTDFIVIWDRYDDSRKNSDLDPDATFTAAKQSVAGYLRVKVVPEG